MPNQGEQIVGKLGADVDQLDQLAMNLDRAAARLEGNASVIEGQVRELWWSGSVADRFAASWASVDRRHLSTIAGSMREVAKRVRLDAQQQRLASGSSGSGAPAIALGGAVFIGAGGSGVALTRLLEIGMDGVGTAADLTVEWLGYIEKFGPGFGSSINVGLQFLAGVGMAYAAYDFFAQKREDNLGWLESTADILKFGAAASVFVPIPGARIVGAVLLGASLAIDAGLWVYDNWEGVKDVATRAGDLVIDAADALVTPYVDVAKGVVDVTEGVVDAVGDAVGDAAEAIGDAVSAPGRLLGSIF